MVYINAEGVGTSFTCTLGFFVKKTIEISSRTRIIKNHVHTEKSNWGGERLGISN